MSKFVSDVDIHTVVNEVDRPFQFVSLLDSLKQEKEVLKCGGCKHLVQKTKLIDLYNEPYFVCKLLNKEIDWPYRDPRPKECTYGR